MTSAKLILASSAWELCTLGQAGSPTNGVTFQINRESKSLQFLVIPVHILTIVTSVFQLATHRGGCAVILSVNAPVLEGRSTLLCYELGSAPSAEHNTMTERDERKGPSREKR
jgi:hypothetical protein